VVRPALPKGVNPVEGYHSVPPGETVESIQVEPSSLPSGDGSCDHLPGPPLVEFDLVRENLPRSGPLLDRLYENSRTSWQFLQSDPENRTLWREEGPDRFRYSLVLTRKKVTTAIDVRRGPPGILWTHAHLYTPRRLDCAIHRYSLTSKAEFGELEERVEIRSTSRILRLYRGRMAAEAMKNANRQLDEIVVDL
jgi:hypothetical protein